MSIHIFKKYIYIYITDTGNSKKEYSDSSYIILLSIPLSKLIDTFNKSQFNIHLFKNKHTLIYINR